MGRRGGDRVSGQRGLSMAEVSWGREAEMQPGSEAACGRAASCSCVVDKNQGDIL